MKDKILYIMCSELLCGVNGEESHFFDILVPITPHNIPIKNYNELNHSIKPLLSRHDGNLTGGTISAAFWRA